jgi:monovalent cation/hydrogen antiporter
VLPRLGHGGEGWATVAQGLAITGVVIVSRFVWIFPSVYIRQALTRILPWSQPEPWLPLRIPVVMSWAGMRGVVSLAAALALPTEFPWRDQVLMVTFFVILGTVLIQAPTLGPLIQRLGLARDSEDGTAEEELARAAMARAELRLMEEKAADLLIGAIARDLLDDYRERVTSTADGRATGGQRAMVQSRVSLRLEALAAARSELLRLHRAGELHDTVLRRLERDVDLEELRFRNRLRALG